MAYDRELYERVQKMPAGELVHLMLTEYEDHNHEDKSSYMQSSTYMWAAERLNELLPAPEETKGTAE